MGNEVITRFWKLEANGKICQGYDWAYLKNLNSVLEVGKLRRSLMYESLKGLGSGENRYLGSGD